jgi:exocyst complex component 5
MGTEDGGVVEGKGLMGRFGVGRLSVMMKELEGSRLAEGLTIGIPTIPSMPAGFVGGS